MTNHEWTVNPREAGLPLLEAVNLRIPAAPQSFLKQLARKQRILHNGEPGDEKIVARAGDIITLSPSLRLDQLVCASRINPGQILYEDKGCIVLDKPAGLMIHPAGGHDTDLLTDLKIFLRHRHETFQVSPVHRLDIGTSGPVLFGKGRASISALGKMLMAGEARKHYLALVCGHPPRQGVLDSHVPSHGKAKEARTRYRCLAEAQDHALLELQLITGRRHQIRQQLADAGWPIVGDSRYRGKPLPGLTHPFLHCCRLAFTHPDDGRIVKVTSALPDELVGQLNVLSISAPDPAIHEKTLPTIDHEQV